MKLVILTTTYNCENYVEKSILSIKSQTYKNFKCFITDDLSTDNTIKRVKNLIFDDERFILIENKTKMYQPGNYDQVIRGNYGVEDDDICVEVDGDDWLPDNGVFDRVLKIYENQEIWMANGSFVYSDGKVGFSFPPSTYENVRNQTFTLSHLRTWKSFLWKKIKIEDLKDENKEYWNVAGDLSFMYPMFEMCGEEHYKFMNEINYVYNDINPINDFKVNLNDVLTISKKIRNKKSYNKLIL